MSPSSLPCINENEYEYLGGLFHHPMAEMTTPRMEKQKCMPSCCVRWINGQLNWMRQSRCDGNHRVKGWKCIMIIHTSCHNIIILL